MRHFRGLDRLALVLLTIVAFSPLAAAKDIDGQHFGNWTVRCQASTPLKEDQKPAEVCYLYQVLKDKEGHNILHISVGFPKHKTDPFMLITTPLGTRLPSGVGIELDGEKTLLAVFQHCQPSGCVAAMTLDPEKHAAFKKAKELRALFAHFTGRTVAVPFYKKGYADGIVAISLQRQSDKTDSSNAWDGE